MRVVTWNINGVRTLPQYHPWNSFKTFDEILNHLEADVICFQEMKSSRQALPKQVALPPSFDSFISFPIRKAGYSGTAVYTRRTSAVPLKAEEGLAGFIQPKPPLNASERISRVGTYPPDIDEPEDGDDIDYKDLDSEGRAVVVDLGLFVLINVYCPNDGTGTEERDKFKMDYHRLLETRVNGLIKEGREVMVVGDINACAAIEDHCEGQLMVDRGLTEGLEGEEGFWGKDSRRWIRDLLIHEGNNKGKMVDIVRKFWPDRKGMYTCWNTKISARDTNYGTRIDFILITPSLVPWIKAADIQPQIKGSDHCPVFVDFKDEITNNDGSIIKLHDVLGARPTADGPAEPPRIAAKNWDEHKQKLLSNFFGKKSNSSSATPTLTPDPSLTTSSKPIPVTANLSLANVSASKTIVIDPSSTQSQAPDTSQIQPLPSQSSANTEPPNGPSKRKIVVESPKAVAKKAKTSQGPKENGKKKEKETNAGQPSIAGFFSQPKAKSSKSASASSSKSTTKTSKAADAVSTDTASSTCSPIDVDVDEDADYRFALLLSQSDDNIMPSSSQSQGSQGTARPEKGKEQESKQAWTTLLAPTQAPLCTVHREPAKEYTVNKPGPNKGKKFFSCSRPVGPGYDKGRAERPREQVDPQWKCHFFKWSSEVRKEMSRNGSA